MTYDISHDMLYVCVHLCMCVYTHIYISASEFQIFLEPIWQSRCLFSDLIVWFGTVLQKLYKKMSLKSKESMTDRLVNNPYSVTC